MPNLQDLMQLALYQDRQYVWQYPGYEHLLDYFSNLLTLQEEPDRWLTFNFTP